MDKNATKSLLFIDHENKRISEQVEVCMRLKNIRGVNAKRALYEIQESAKNILDEIAQILEGEK